ncbi:zinc finger and BTB domain-containing protein 21 [Periophthalmus magnuspinnatus]|uniref:zinc finger and BTB domain-containing protein 21 n=1 Tax=Periophthalmus magnuspinnatus TaxID=409849 RepID=UPI00145B6585|nr:zinc finger and BTB domain-containing protein 21 [Periophthalmus magnuspinnatus]
MESLMHYSNPSHALSVLGVLNEQRLKGQMCDVILVVADQKYNAHKSVLAASSEYFQSLFTRMDTESTRVVNLDFCEPDAFEIVLNYIYSSSLFVDNGSLAAIQELGYSLGIPFLTNIASARPHASYCVSRKRFSFSEGDENDVQARSVIVRRVKTETSPPSYPNYSNKTPETVPSSLSTRETPPPSVQNSFKSIKTSESMKSSKMTDTSERKSIHPYTSILKGNSSHITSVRPQLTSSVSFSDAEVQHIRLQCDQNTREDSGQYDSHYQSKVPLQGPAQEPSQTIDRSGPLIKSLLRRSLSMDSPVPVFSPTLELRELQNREQSVVKMASRVSGPETPIHNGGPKRTSPLVLRSRCPSRYDAETQVDRDVSVKAEPSSPLGDPMDIVRITVGDALPVRLKDFQTNFEQNIKPDMNISVKRKDRPDNRRYPFKKNKLHGLRSEENISETIPQSAGAELDENSDELHPGKTFKCWNCLKVFRSSAGLHRHVNMYHNPEKPYVCEICHKRFHTNFKVWTHCQTQHGVMQNPASSSTSVLDEKFQKKLIDIVREREIKKALLWKLKRNKQGLQSSVLGKKKVRTNFICPYCGKVYVFQSQYRQHIKSHLFSHQRTERTEQETRDDMPQGGELSPENNADSGVYFCRLCNVKLSSLFEQGDHERGCRHATVCPYCGLRFSSPLVKKDHEAHCKYKKLTCLECMRTFKSSFSIWRHQVEVHNHNMMSAKDQLELTHQENCQEGMEEDMFREEQYSSAHMHTSSAREDMSYSNSVGQPIYDSEDSSSYVPEDLSMSHHGKLVVKEEPIEEDVSERENTDTTKAGAEEPGVWPCEKCGNLFSSRKDLERHQELLCHIKPFICHICNKAFRTNFRLWSHFQSHMSTNEQGAKEIERQPSPLSPSPPLTPQNSEHPPSQASVVKSTQPVPVAASVSEESGSPEPSGSVSKSRRAEFELPPTSPRPVSRTNSLENPAGPQEPDTLFYHAPSLSALTFKRQYMCKLCHRTFKTAFSLWSHEQSHSHM